ncbi:hypothetical protein ACEWPM_016255 [Roseovarius sp. S4756]|uniref:hypothetical protein n=1 Tax=Roseovarius maritimus TaxID=3342637 RepID=UPI00372A7421
MSVLRRGLITFTVAMMCVQSAFAAPFVVVSEGEGPTERVVEYRLAPDAGDEMLPDNSVESVLGAMQTERASAIMDSSLNVGFGLFGDGLGAAASVATIAEHAVMIPSLSTTNNILAYAGLVITVLQVSSDLRAGEHKSAGVNAYKGTLSFVVGKFGWGALQIGGVSLFVVDVILREVESGARDIYLDRWRPVFARFLRESPEARRSINDWKRIVWNLYLEAESYAGDDSEERRDYFREALSYEIASYLAKADMASISLYADFDRTGGGTSGLNDQIMKDLRESFTFRLEAMLVRDVLPEITERAEERQLRLILERMNRDLRPEMNKPVRLDVTAWGVPSGQVRIPLAEGEWGGPLEPNGTFSMEFTNFAWIKAGLPQRIILDGPDGRQEAPLQVQGDRAVAIFGQPKASLIARSVLTEGRRYCSLTRYTLDRSFIDSERREDRDRAPVTLDTAIMPGDLVIVGRYDSDTGQWTQASPGVWRYGDQLHLGEPRIDGLSILENCRISLMTPEGEVAQSQCRLVRQREWIRNGELRSLRCGSDAEVDLQGVFTDIGEGMKYYALDGEVGKMLTQVLRRSISEGVEGMSPDMLQGLSGGLPGGN